MPDGVFASATDRGLNCASCAAACRALRLAAAAAVSAGGEPHSTSSSLLMKGRSPAVVGLGMGGRALATPDLGRCGGCPLVSAGLV